VFFVVSDPTMSGMWAKKLPFTFWMTGGSWKSATGMGFPPVPSLLMLTVSR
jgi:hypothetical protein